MAHIRNGFIYDDANDYIIGVIDSDDGKETYFAFSDANGNLVLPNSSGSGILISHGESPPSYGWSDLTGVIQVDANGVSAPVMAVWRGSVENLAYNANDKQSWSMHCEHCEVSSGDKFIHAHIRHNGTSVTGNLVLRFEISHNYGHLRLGSPAPITKTATIDMSAIPQYDTHIEDILFMQSGGGVGLLDSSSLLPDDDFIVQITVLSIPTITGGTTSRVFIPFVDIHREVTNVLGTKNKSPNFYE